MSGVARAQKEVRDARSVESNDALAGSLVLTASVASAAPLPPSIPHPTAVRALSNSHAKVAQAVWAAGAVRAAAEEVMAAAPAVAVATEGGGGGDGGGPAVAVARRTGRRRWW